MEQQNEENREWNTKEETTEKNPVRLYARIVMYTALFNVLSGIYYIVLMGFVSIYCLAGASGVFAAKKYNLQACCIYMIYLFVAIIARFILIMIYPELEIIIGAVVSAIIDLVSLVYSFKFYKIISKTSKDDLKDYSETTSFCCGSDLDLNQEADNNPPVNSAI